MCCITGYKPSGYNSFNAITIHFTSFTAEVLYYSASYKQQRSYNNGNSNLFRASKIYLHIKRVTLN